MECATQASGNFLGTLFLRKSVRNYSNSEVSTEKANLAEKVQEAEAAGKKARDALATAQNARDEAEIALADIKAEMGTDQVKEQGIRRRIK